MGYKSLKAKNRKLRKTKKHNKTKRFYKNKRTKTFKCVYKGGIEPGSQQPLTGLEQPIELKQQEPQPTESQQDQPLTGLEQSAESQQDQPLTGLEQSAELQQELTGLKQSTELQQEQQFFTEPLDSSPTNQLPQSDGQYELLAEYDPAKKTDTKEKGEDTNEFNKEIINHVNKKRSCINQLLKEGIIKQEQVEKFKSGFFGNIAYPQIMGLSFPVIPEYYIDPGYILVCRYYAHGITDLEKEFYLDEEKGNKTHYWLKKGDAVETQPSKGVGEYGYHCVDVDETLNSSDRRTRYTLDYFLEGINITNWVYRYRRLGELKGKPGVHGNVILPINEARDILKSKETSVDKKVKTLRDAIIHAVTYLKIFVEGLLKKIKESPTKESWKRIKRTRKDKIWVFSYFEVCYLRKYMHELYELEKELKQLEKTPRATGWNPFSWKR
jgi:hypothetical protein